MTILEQVREALGLDIDDLHEQIQKLKQENALLTAELEMARMRNREIVIGQGTTSSPYRHITVSTPDTGWATSANSTVRFELIGGGGGGGTGNVNTVRMLDTTGVDNLHEIRWLPDPEGLNSVDE